METDSPTTVVFSGNTADTALPVRNDKSPVSGIENKALRTAAILQTTLELEKLLRLFSREIADEVPHYGLHYLNEEEDVDLTIGRQAKHTMAFRPIFKQQLLGKLIMMRGKPFTQKESATLEFYLGSLVYPLRNTLQYQKLRHESLLDPLTRVYNRSVMNDALKRETGLARRHHNPLSFLIIDIDDFKHINDTHGHLTGDKLIKTVAKAIASCLRSTDMVCRFGGDEFTVLLSNTGKDGAMRVAENIRHTIEGATRAAGTVQQTTASIGVATLNSRNKDIDLLSAADEALFQAKDRGRNCVVAAD